MNSNAIAVAKGDGIGPEIMDAVIRIFDAAGVPLRYDHIDMGKSVFDKGYSTGMTDEAMKTVEEAGVLFKGPMETPKGTGVKSINVTARKLWNTYANVRIFRTIEGVDTIFSKAGIPINITLLRENIEDTYGGIEYMHTPDVAISYRLVTRPGTEQFVRFAFDYAKRHNISKITCGHKANIMKLTDGLFMNEFYKMAKEYPEIEVEDVIVDALAMRLVNHPEWYEMIILTNLQGDILSDLCAGLVGGLGFAPSANVGDYISIFEAVHGTAPDIAGKGMANPTSLLLSGLMMLRHVGLLSQADNIENALFYSLEQGVHTGDFGSPGTPKLSTQGFADAIIGNLGKKPERTRPADAKKENFNYTRQKGPQEMRMLEESNNKSTRFVGMDIFIESDASPDDIAAKVRKGLQGRLELTLISNRGTQVWPESSRFTDSVAHYCLRFEQAVNHKPLTHTELLALSQKVAEKFTIADIVFLHEFNGERGYSLAQGQ